MEKVKRLVEAGLKPANAIKEALGMTVSDFADKHKLPRGTTSEVINGSRKGTPAQLKALVKELGGTPAEWATYLWESGKPEVNAGAGR